MVGGSIIWGGETDRPTVPAQLLRTEHPPKSLQCFALRACECQHVAMSEHRVALSATESSCVLWTLRTIARRERRRGPEARRLTEPGLGRWRAFVGGGGRLHAGDLILLALENAAAVNPLGYRLPKKLDEEDGEAFLSEAFKEGTWVTTGVADYLEGLALAFGRPPLSAQRRAAFGPIRFDQRILEFPSTAARVAASVAPKDAPIETYVTYVVADDVDRFIVGCAMAEFDRPLAPTLIDIVALKRGDQSAITASFTKAATLVPNDPLANLLPPTAIGDRLVVL